MPFLWVPYARHRLPRTTDAAPAAAARAAAAFAAAALAAATLAAAALAAAIAAAAIAAAIAAHAAAALALAAAAHAAAAAAADVTGFAVRVNTQVLYISLNCHRLKCSFRHLATQHLGVFRDCIILSLIPLLYC